MYRLAHRPSSKKYYASREIAALLDEDVADELVAEVMAKVGK